MIIWYLNIVEISVRNRFEMVKETIFGYKKTPKTIKKAIKAVFSKK